MRRWSLLVFALLLGCAVTAKQLDTSKVPPADPGGQVVEFSDVGGKYPDVVSASLYFYPGKFSIPLKPSRGGVWRGDLTAGQVTGMVPERYGFRVYRCRLTVVSKDASGQIDSSSRDVDVALQPV